jgi:hypothetical protein
MRPDIVMRATIVVIVAPIVTAVVLPMVGAAAIMIVAPVMVVGIHRREQSERHHTSKHEGNFRIHGRNG